MDIGPSQKSKLNSGIIELLKKFRIPVPIKVIKTNNTAIPGWGFLKI
jgi:hypothetical protein